MACNKLARKTTSSYDEPMLFSLTLQNPIAYRQAEHCLDDIFNLPAGSEICFCFSFHYEDVIFTLEPLWSGEREPATEEEKKMIEKGLPVPPRPGHDRSIPPGRYILVQTLPSQTMEELRLACFQAAGTMRSGCIHVRYLKENDFETVMQLFVAQD